MSTPSLLWKSWSLSSTGDEKTGAQIIAKVLEAPVRQIAENAGVDGSVVFEKIQSSGKVGYGYNAYTEEFCRHDPRRYR